ncbi:hypothetical protein BKA66DRAFT_442786 [Pyrenochaeta sp. MPI-SDFR-AT-0127]|nr:hypothetical protein BKA66DRAFT_442786 [Pyrenochaeta sp. MPI-SDFR-AT-0127]
MSATPTTSNSQPIIGPLTTEFAQPTYCNFVHVRCDSSNACFLTRDVSCGVDSKAWWGTQCYPSGTGTFTSYTQNGQVMSGPIYSPAVSCPSGYATMTQDGVTDPAIIDCCPSGYTIASNAAYCYSSLSFAMAAWCCTGHLTGELVPITLVQSPSRHFNYNSNGTIVDIGASVYGEPVRLIRGVPISSVSISQPTGSMSNNNGGGSRTSLSGGAIAGIAIGALVFGVLLAAAVFILLRRHQLRRKAQPGNPDSTVPGDGGKAELPGDSGASYVNQHRYGQELDSSPLGVISGAQPVELAANSTQTDATGRTG